MKAQAPDHVDDAAVWATAHWWNSPRPLVPYLKRKFSLSDNEALTALRAASDEIMRGRQ